MPRPKSIYPLGVSLSMIIGVVALSFVELTFLNDIIGKVLDFGFIESMLVAFTLGLVGIAIMAHQGIKEAHRVQPNSSSHIVGTLVHYTLWIALGVIFSLLRLFSATLMALEEGLGDEGLQSILGLQVRDVDIILAPLMLFLYLATGILAKDGVKNLLLNPEYHKWWEERKESRLLKKSEEYKRRKQAEEQLEKERARAESKRIQMENEINGAKNQKLLDAAYETALVNYRNKEDEVKKRYELIKSNIEYIKFIDKQEYAFETRTKPGFFSVIDSSILSAQNEVLLMINRRNKSSQEIESLRNALETHNLSIRASDREKKS